MGTVRCVRVGNVPSQLATKIEAPRFAPMQCGRRRSRRVGDMTSFVGGNVGSWRVLRVDPGIGGPPAWISRVKVTEQAGQPPPGNWGLRGGTPVRRSGTRPWRGPLAA